MPATARQVKVPRQYNLYDTAYRYRDELILKNGRKYLTASSHGRAVSSFEAFFEYGKLSFIREHDSLKRAKGHIDHLQRLRKHHATCRVCEHQIRESRAVHMADPASGTSWWEHLSHCDECGKDADGAVTCQSCWDKLVEQDMYRQAYVAGQE